MMSRRNQVTAIATTGALLHVAGELRHEFKEDIREMKEDIRDLRESQDNAATHLHNTVSDLNDDIKTIKEQLLLLTRESKNNRESDQSVPPSEQGCSSSRDISDVTVSVDENEMELRDRTSTQGECFC